MSYPTQQPGSSPTYGSTLPKSTAGSRIRSLLLFLVAIALVGGLGYGISTKRRQDASQAAVIPTSSSTTVGIKPIDNAIAAACDANKKAVAIAVNAYQAEHGTFPAGADDEARIQALVTGGFLREAPPTNAGYRILLTPAGAVSADRC